ncbi:MAG: amidohydrolase family protein [Bacillota bacterium]
MQDIMLSQYKPRSELIVERHEVMKPRHPVIDVHTHMGSLVLGENYAQLYDTGDFIKKLDRYGVKTIVNLDGAWGGELDRMLAKTKGYEDKIITFGWINTGDIDNPAFGRNVETDLKDGFRKGIRGIKLWKMISLGQKDKTGRYIRIDDKRLKPIWDTAAELGIPVLIHIADPIAFFKEADQYNERFEELAWNPDWSFSGPQFYKFHELMDMQEAMLAGNPQTTFVIAHAGSAAEDLKFVGGCLDKYPNMHIDIAARIAELGRQPYTAREFLIKYQDRVLFGTDYTPVCMPYEYYYRFLETRDEYFDYGPGEIPGQGRWKIYGVFLPDEALRKIYYENAEKLLRLDTRGLIV